MSLSNQNSIQKKWKITDSIFLFILFVPLLEPEGLGRLVPFVSNAVWNNYVKAAVGVVILMMFIAKMLYNAKWNRGFMYLIAFVGLLLAISVYMSISINSWYISYINLILLCMLVEIYSDNLTRLVDIALVYLEILIYINFVCCILYPNGMYLSEANNSMLCWFLGYKSSLQYYVVPAIALMWLKKQYQKIGFRMWALIITCCIETVISHNAMLLVSIVIIMFVLLFRLYKKTKIFNAKLYMVVIAALNLLFILYTDVFITSRLGQFMLSFFGKSNTLSNRLIIWAAAKKYIARKPLTGYGVISSSQHANIFGIEGIMHSHNQILEILLCGGLITLFVFVVWMIYMTKQLLKYKELRSAKVLGIFSFVIFIMVTVEVFSRSIGTGIWLVLILIGFLPELDEQYSQQENCIDDVTAVEKIDSSELERGKPFGS